MRTNPAGDIETRSRRFVKMTDKADLILRRRDGQWQIDGLSYSFAYLTNRPEPATDREIEPVYELRELNSFSIYAPISPSCIRRMAALHPRELAFHWNVSEEQAKAACDLHSLEAFEIGSSRWGTINDRDLAPLQCLAHLRRIVLKVDLDRSALEFLRPLENLTELDLDYNEISKDGIARISGLRGLRHLTRFGVSGARWLGCICKFATVGTSRFCKL